VGFSTKTVCLGQRMTCQNFQSKQSGCRSSR